jgi:microcystin degradation protein MlrC
MRCGPMRAAQASPATASTTNKSVTNVVMPRQLRPAVALVLAAVLGACSGGSSTSATSSPESTAGSSTTTTTSAAATTTTTTALADVSTALGTPTIASAGTIGPAGNTDTLSVADKIQTAVAEYERIAIGTALNGSTGDLTGLLTAAVAKTLTPEQRAALTDEATVRASAVSAGTNSIALTGYTGNDGAISVVNAVLSLNVSGTTAGGAPFTIKRSGNLTFVDDGGAWRIDSFDLTVDRDLP